MANHSVRGFYFHRSMEAEEVTRLLLKDEAKKSASIRGARKAASRRK